MTKKLTRIETKELLKQERTARVKDTIEEVSEKALDSVIELSQNAVKENVRLDASKDILDRAGYAPVQKIAVAQLQPITGMRFVYEDDDAKPKKKK